MYDYDVIIVGAGVGGAHLSRRLRSSGARVLLLEREKDVKVDSGIVSRDVLKYIRIPKRVVREKISEMVFVSPRGKEVSLATKKYFALLIDSAKFRRWLRREAERYCELRFETCKYVSVKKEFVEVSTDKSTYVAKLVVACDGAVSRVRSALGLTPPKIFSSARCRVKRNRHRRITVYFNKNYSPHFFAWEIPKSREIGLICRDWIGEHLNLFVKENGFEVEEKTFAPVAVGAVKSYARRCVLLGDACGQTKPFTAGGIVYAIRCAEIAGAVIKRLLSENRFDERSLAVYEKRWKREIGFEISLQMFLRNLYRRMSNNDIEKMFALLGREIERIRELEYDRISSLLRNLPKRKLLKALLLLLPVILARCYY